MAIFGDTSTTVEYDVPWSSGNALGMKYTLSEDADVSSCSFYAKYNNAEQAFRMAIYAMDGTTVGALKMMTAEHVITSGDSSYSWHECLRYGGGTEFLAAGDYWIWLWPGGTSEGARIALTAWSGGTYCYRDGITYSSTDPLPNPMTSEAGPLTDMAYAFYATYTVPSSVPEAPTINAYQSGSNIIVAW